MKTSISNPQEVSRGASKHAQDLSIETHPPVPDKSISPTTDEDGGEAKEVNVSVPLPPESNPMTAKKVSELPQGPIMLEVDIAHPVEEEARERLFKYAQDEGSESHFPSEHASSTIRFLQQCFPAEVTRADQIVHQAAGTADERDESLAYIGAQNEAESSVLFPNNLEVGSATTGSSSDIQSVGDDNVDVATEDSLGPTSPTNGPRHPSASQSPPPFKPKAPANPAYINPFRQAPSQPHVPTKPGPPLEIDDDYESDNQDAASESKTPNATTATCEDYATMHGQASLSSSHMDSGLRTAMQREMEFDALLNSFMTPPARPHYHRASQMIMDRVADGTPVQAARKEQTVRKRKRENSL